MDVKKEDLEVNVIEHEDGSASIELTLSQVLETFFREEADKVNLPVEKFLENIIIENAKKHAEEQKTK